MSQRFRLRFPAAKLATLVAMLIVATMLPVEARADDPDLAARRQQDLQEARRVFEIGFDAVILRPLGLGAQLVGAALFVPAAIFSAPTGFEGFKEAREYFITIPYKHVFERRLGSFP